MGEKTPMRKGLGRGAIPTLTVLWVLAAVGMVLALKLGGQRAELVFTPPAFDPSAAEGVPQPEESLGYGQLDAEVYQVSLCGRPALTGKSLKVYLTNPEGNAVWLKVRICTEDGEVLGESGLLRPGEYLETVELVRTLSENTAIQMRIMAYEPETYHSAGAVSLSTAVKAAQ